MANLLLPDMETYEIWSEQLGIPFEKVLKKAGVSDPDVARASRARLRKGEAPRVRQALHDVLSDFERQRERPTEMGAVLLGLDEWKTLGAELADIDAKRFLMLLDALRVQVEMSREARKAESPFFDIKPRKPER